MSDATGDTARRLEPVPALMVSLLAMGLSYTVFTALQAIQFGAVESVTPGWNLDEDFERLSLFEALGFTEPAAIAIAVVSILAGLAGYLGLKRQARWSHLNLPTLVIGLALAPVIMSGLNWISWLILWQ